jgi:hypothetical protein
LWQPLIASLLSRLFPVRPLGMELVKHSTPDDATKRVQKFAGDRWRHRIQRPELVRRRPGLGGRF